MLSVSTEFQVITLENNLETILGDPPNKYYLDFIETYMTEILSLSKGGCHFFFENDKFKCRVDSVNLIEFEPFKPTYERALNNLNLNPELNKKIITYNFALGSDTKELEIGYDPTQSIGMSIRPDTNSTKVVEKIKVV
jgi:hypothetical protein